MPVSTIPRQYYVHIMSSKSRCLYVGVTRDLVRRVGHHKELIPGPRGFTSRYHAHRLAYYESTTDVRAALAREKHLKRWLRKRKLALVTQANPTWRDLAAAWPGIDAIG